MFHDSNASHQRTTTPSSAAALSPIPASTTIGGVQAPAPPRAPGGPTGVMEPLELNQNFAGANHVLGIGLRDSSCFFQSTSNHGVSRVMSDAL
ncbi:hypothetical protein CMUS01_12721 [Colletotrichum musicola]|uniref:Uncharacterized protein n=1 Tax=Colletotrichum musicola TaxID=2175873 RepID=A0A8H6JK06_9PEZI|nr:hypothetical protein CMUS01_12721 [Colletotrichum musicola]